MSSAPSEADIREEVTMFLRRNFPQIKMHGGSFTIDSVTPETGAIKITLNGACNGCGISPMTIEAIQLRLCQNVPEIQSVDVDTHENRDAVGNGLPSGLVDSAGNDFSDVPF